MFEGRIGPEIPLAAICSTDCLCEAKTIVLRVVSFGTPFVQVMRMKIFCVERRCKLWPELGRTIPRSTPHDIFSMEKETYIIQSIIKIIIDETP